MRRLFLTLVLLAFGTLTGMAQQPEIRRAEDLWGNPIPFSKVIASKKTTLVQPFSPSNCGYCLFDGWFAKENYLEPNLVRGGRSFTQSLFNPQIDICTFTKHYRDEKIPVLTWPPELYRYHRDGYPAILAFRDGQQIVSVPEGYLCPYDSAFYRLRETFWGDTVQRLRLTSDLQLTTRIIYENMNHTAVCVVPDGDTAGFRRNSEFAARAHCYTVKYFSDLLPADRLKNLLFEGRFPAAAYRSFLDENTPFTVKGDSVLSFGPYRFRTDTIGVAACFPNPADPEKVVVLRIRGTGLAKGYFDNSVDYSIYSSDRVAGTTRLLISGYFGKSSTGWWSYADSLCVANIPVARECVGVCTMPARKIHAVHEVNVSMPVIRKKEGRDEYMLGTGACRFPAITRTGDSTVWVAWEEEGDINISPLNGPANAPAFSAEHDASDSYHPLLAATGSRVWIFYLNNRGGFYRLYGRYREGNTLSEPIQLSQSWPCDAISPAVTVSGDQVFVAWSCWKANQRLPYWRSIRGTLPDSIQPVTVVESESLRGYTNAWYLQLAPGADGSAWGAWNQHYPAVLGVCSGDLGGNPVSVTRTAVHIEDCESGGYPALLTDREDRRWVFYETDAWEITEGGRQRILGSTFDPATGQWGNTISLPVDAKTIVNQTPAAALLADGRLAVAWSGRAAGGEWTLFLTIRDREGWRPSQPITNGKEPARAPKLLASGDGALWITYHEGRGRKMRIGVVRMKP